MPRTKAATTGRAGLVYHFHHAWEELPVVLRGRPTLRTKEGERQLKEGEVVHFPVCPAGAHGLTNHTEEPVRFLMTSTPRRRRARGPASASG